MEMQKPKKMRKVRKISNTRKVSVVCVVFIVIGILIWLGGVFEYWFLGRENVSHSNHKMLVGIGLMMIFAIVFCCQLLFYRNVMIAKFMKKYGEHRREKEEKRLALETEDKK